MLSFSIWIALGVLAGFLAARFFHIKSGDLPGYLGLGAVGAVIGGWRFSTHGINILSVWNSTSVNGYGLFVALAGAVALLVAYHWLFHAMLERAEENVY